MLKERARIVAGGLYALDLLLVLSAFLLAFWLRNRVLPGLGVVPDRLYPLARYLPLLPVVLGLWALLLPRSGLYGSHRTMSLREEAWEIVRACAVAALLLVLVIFAVRLDDLLLDGDRISRLWILLVVSLACLLLLGRMLLVRLVARYVRLHGYNYRNLLIVGSGRQAREIVDSVGRHRFWGYRVVGVVVDDEAAAHDPLGGHPVLGGLAEIPRIVEEQVVDEVIFTLDRARLSRLEDLLLQLEELGIRVWVVLDLFPHAKARVDVGTLDGIPVMTYSTAPSSELGLLVKRTLDVSISAVLLLLALPAMVTVALAIKLAYGGSVLFRQTRCGLNGRQFTLYKFRTMVEDAEARREDLEHLNEVRGPAFKLSRDPRVTTLGRLLRKFSLDELPQLWNVLRGDMSLVGPRPPIPSEVSRYQRWQRRRLSMRPGLTCLWQVSGRSDLDFDRWMELDLQYIDSWSPLLDLKILARTVPAVLSGRGAS